jgi:hypothetical protein
MATFYVKLGDDESTDEPVAVGSEQWDELVTDETLLWADHLPDCECSCVRASGALFPGSRALSDGRSLCARAGYSWAELKETEYVLSGGEAGGEADAGAAECENLYYDGCDDEISTQQLQALVDEGTIEDETLCWSQDAAWPFEGWTPWWECSYVFGMGDAPGVCGSLYYEGGEDEVSRATALELAESGTITEETLVYSDDAAFFFEGWTAWWECSYLFGVGEAPGCTSLYYDGCDDEVSTEQLEELVEAGTITDETLVWSQQNSFPFEGWTAWWQCSYVFGMGEAPDGTCSSLYYEGGEDEGEVAKDRVLELVESGTITEETLIYSDDAAFHFEGWTHWSECSYLFGVGEAPSGGCTSLWIEGGEEELGIAELMAGLTDGSISDETLCYSSDPGFGFEGWTEWCECKGQFATAEEEEEQEQEQGAAEGTDAAEEGLLEGAAAGTEPEPEPEQEPRQNAQSEDADAAEDAEAEQGGGEQDDADGDEGDEGDSDGDGDGDGSAAAPGGIPKPRTGGPTGVKKNKKKKKKPADGDAGGIPKKKKKKPPLGDGSGGGIPPKPKRDKPEKHKKKKSYGMAEGAKLVMVENPDISSTSEVIFTLEQLQDKSFWAEQTAAGGALADGGGGGAGTGLEDRWLYLSVRASARARVRAWVRVVVVSVTGVRCGLDIAAPLATCVCVPPLGR